MTQVSRWRQALYGLTNWALFAAGLINLGIGTWSALHQGVAIAATSLTAGLVLLFAATIDRFESLKGLGVEAKTRQLDKKLEQADEALSRLKELAELTGATLIDLSSKMGRWDSAPSPGEAYALAQRVRAILVGLASDPSRIRATLEPFGLMMCRDLAFALTGELRDAAVQEIGRLSHERSKIPMPVSPTDPNWTRLNAEISAMHKYRDEKLGKLPGELDAYPDAFLDIFGSAPLLDQDLVRTSRERAEKFVPGMRSMRENFTLPDPDSWFVEIEKSRRPK